MTGDKATAHWNGSIAAHLTQPPKIQPSVKIRWKSSHIDFFLSRWHPSHSLSSKGQNYQRGVLISLLVQLKDILKLKRRGKFTKGVLFWHDNVPAHQSLAIQKKLAYLGFQSLHHPTYSPDLAPSYYHLFPGLKKQLKCPFFV
jgi:hypothetical protein